MAALVINALLFVSIPFLQNLLGFGPHLKTQPDQKRAIIAEYVRPQTKEVKPPTAIFRSVRPGATSHAGAGSGSGEGPSMRFTPDLAVEGGSGAGIAMGGGDLSAMVFEEGKTDEGITSLSMDPIPYPDEAREQGVEGSLEVLLVIGRDGRVAAIEIVRSPHPAITAVARRIIAQWKFKPAKNKGVPVNVRVRKVIDFKLD